MSMILLPIPAGGATEIFTANSNGPLRITWHGRELISSDEISALGNDGFAKPTGYRAETIQGAIVQNMWITADKTNPIPVRRELAVENNVVEITAQYEIPSYFMDEYANYTIRIPLSALSGFSYKGYTGRYLKVISGVIPSEAKDTETFLGMLAFLVLEKGNRRIVFDFNPSGPSADNRYGPVELVGLWSVRISSGFIEMYFIGGSKSVCGGLSNSIVRIIDGATFDDYKKYHPYTKYRYFDYVPVITNMNFGPERLFGLKTDESKPSIQTSSDGQSGALHSFAQGSGKATLPLSFPQPGLYVITIRTGGSAESFRVGMEDQTVTKTKRINADQCQTVTIPYYAKITHGILSLNDNWKVSSLVIQPLIYQSEDFTFTRRLWRAKDIPTPSNFYCGPLQNTNFKVDVQIFSWKGSDPSRLRGKTQSLPAETVRKIPPDDPDFLWRWSANIGGLGPNNLGSFHEFDNPKVLSRRMDDLQQKGFNVLLVNGLLFRHNWPDQLERVTHALKDITDQAHKRGIKVIDHQDLSILLNVDCGLSVMCHNIGWTQRDLRNGQVTRGWCVNNPDYRKQYFTYIKNLVKNTGIDGLMLDEVAFHKDYFCGCEHCRRKFREMTGLDMPADETSPIINKKSNYLWQLWLEFRARSLGDFKIALQDAVKEVNPNFIQINYTTHWGLMSGGSFWRSGGDMTQVARSSNMLGTEIMSRNVFECYRQVYAGRAITNSLRWTYGVPIFGLIYHLHQPSFAYTGWAMNNMHGQSTWFFSEPKASSDACAKYVTWNDNMQSYRAVPVSDVAILFSQPSRNHLGANSQERDQEHELLGICEMLGDLHIQYDVRSNIGLTSEDLKVYPLLIIPSCANMSDTDYDVIQKYLEQGGSVLATYDAGRNDEFGFPRKTWPLGNWLGIDVIGKSDKPDATWNGVVLKDPVFRIQAHNNDIVIRQKLHINEKEYPAAVQKIIGRGQLTYTPVTLGKQNVQTAVRNGSKWTWRPDPKVNKLFQFLLQTSLQKPFTFTSPSDSRIRMKFWKYADQPVWMLHVLNCTGASMKPGDILTSIPPENPYPALAEDIICNIDLGKKHDSSNITAYWTSPDAQDKERTPLEIRKKGNGIISITIPREVLKTYGIAYIEAK